MQEINSIESYLDQDSHKKASRLGMKNFEKWKKDILCNWIKMNRDHPYPSELEKDRLADLCQMSKKQICNWFTNTRKRYSGMMNESKLVKRRRKQSGKTYIQNNPISYDMMPYFDNRCSNQQDIANFSGWTQNYCMCDLYETMACLNNNTYQTYNMGNNFDQRTDLFSMFQ